MMDYMEGRRKGAVRWGASHFPWKSSDVLASAPLKYMMLIPGLVDVFPASTQLSSLRNEVDAVRLVDIGGNHGHDLKLFRQAYPELTGRLILEDLPAVISKHTGPIEGIEVVPYDFFTPQPIHGRCSFV